VTCSFTNGGKTGELVRELMLGPPGKPQPAITVGALHFDDIMDRRHAFDQAAEAFDYVWHGKHVGKVAIEMQKSTGSLSWRL
jgi:hypothetical protein